MMKLEKIFELVYLVVGFLVVLEFAFVRGQFTWLIAVFAIAVCGIINVLLTLRSANFKQTALYILCTIGLCMGYLALV